MKRFGIKYLHISINTYINLYKVHSLHGIREYGVTTKLK